MLYIIVSIFLLLFCFFLLYKRLQISYSLSPSVIVTNKELNLISKWINPYSVFNFTLIYRASENGDSSKIFQKSIYNRGKILLFISTKDDWKFGGYTDTKSQVIPNQLGWLSQPCKESFIFSINKKRKYPLSEVDDGGVMYKNSLGLSFGKGDFVIVDKFLTNKCSCNFPFSFGDKQLSRNEFNGGKWDFNIKEVEVFLVEKQMN